MAADDVERKVALLLEHGVRADRRAAEAFVACSSCSACGVADYQHRIELLRMYRLPAGRESMCYLFASWAHDQVAAVAGLPETSTSALRDVLMRVGKGVRSNRLCSLLRCALSRTGAHYCAFASRL